MKDNEQMTFEGMPEPKPVTLDGVAVFAREFTDKVRALIEFAEAHGVPALPDGTFADRLRANAREVTWIASEPTSPCATA